MSNAPPTAIDKPIRPGSKPASDGSSIRSHRLDRRAEHAVTRATRSKHAVKLSIHARR